MPLPRRRTWESVPDDCEALADCDGNGVPDACEAFEDCDSNGIPDRCEADCDDDGTPDACEVDCNASGVPDDCEAFEDCNRNGVPDSCDIDSGDSTDSDGDGVPDACQSLGELYCFGAPNSVGDGARLRALGSASVGDNDFSLYGEALPPGVSALYFFGLERIEVPFGDGLRCVGGTTRRIPPLVQADAAGVIDFALDLTRPDLASLLPETEWNFQLWYRDTAGPGASGFNLSNAVSVPFE